MSVVFFAHACACFFLSLNGIILCYLLPTMLKYWSFALYSLLRTRLCQHNSLHVLRSRFQLSINKMHPKENE